MEESSIETIIDELINTVESTTIPDKIINAEDTDPEFNKLTIEQNNNIKNRGTGAGGANTNKSGLPFEEITNLLNRTTTQESGEITFDNNPKSYIRTKKANLFSHMKREVDANIVKAHGCKQPDECYIDKELRNMFIIEKKNQQCSGSVCEKIQTPDFKLWQYNRTFPDYNVVYIYCLSDWFKENCKAEIEYLVYKGVPFFWGNSKTYKDDIIDFIINYK